MPETTHSRKPIIARMRDYIRPHVATVSLIQPNQPLTARQHQSLIFLIENTHAFLRVIDGLDDMLQECLCKSASGQALIELNRDHPDIPELVWNAFVASETEYLALDT